MSEIKKVLVGIPNEHAVPWKAFESFLDLAYYQGFMCHKQRVEEVSPRYEFLWYSIGRMFTPMARERLCDHALVLNCDYVFMMDNDMLYERDMFYRLVRHGVDLVAPLAFTRNSPYFPVAYNAIEGVDPLTHRNYFQNHYVKNLPKNQLVRCDAVGFGAVVMHTRVLKGMEKPWFMGSQGTGEDIYFCYEARKKGFKVYMDTSVKTTHLGNEVEIHEAYAQQHWQDLGIDQEKEWPKHHKYEGEFLKEKELV